MANAKISNSSVFQLGGQYNDVTNILAIPGYGINAGTGSNENCAISGTQLVTSLESNLSLSNFTTGILPIARGGTGTNTTAYASLDDTFGGRNVYGVLGIDNGGTGSANTWKAVQQYAWDGTSTLYTNIPNATDIILPFNNTPLIDQSNNTAGATKWVISTTPVSPAPTAGPVNESAFTLGSNGGGIWKIEVFYCSFNMIDFVEGRISLDIDGTIIPIVQRNFGSPSGTTNVIQTLEGSLTYNFSGNEVVKVQLRFDGAGGSGPYPGNTGVYLNRPPEITFTRVI